MKPAQNSPNAVLQSLSLVHHFAQHVMPSSMHSNAGPHSSRPRQLSHWTPAPATSQNGMLVDVGTQCWLAPQPAAGLSGLQVTGPLPVELIELLDATVVEATDVDATEVDATVDPATVEPATVEFAELLATVVELAELFATVEFAAEVFDDVEPFDCMPPEPAPPKPSPSSVAPVAQANRVAEARERKTTVERTSEA